MEEFKDSFTEEAFDLLVKSRELARDRSDEFFTPEHLMYVMCDNYRFSHAVRSVGGVVDRLRDALLESMDEVDKLPPGYEPDMSCQFEILIDTARDHALSAGRDRATVQMLAMSFMDLDDSEALNALQTEIEGPFVDLLCDMVEGDDPVAGSGRVPAGDPAAKGSDEKGWRRLVTCVNDMLDTRNPLVGREAELERTLQVLCRKDKNNPLHVGEPGVGKTALVYGLARMIERGDVPECLRGSRIYQLDLGGFIAGTQYRGDFEKKIQTVMEGLSAEENAIVYIDEIHNLVGAGAVNGGSLDASNMLKPWFESGRIRFIGATTYEEFNRHLSKDKALLRRFQQIDVPEPSEEEAIRILSGLKENYERFHNVVYDDDVIEYAVRAGARHITGRFLPDKAIDLIDEAGAYRRLHPLAGDGLQRVDTALVSEVLSKVCKVDTLAMQADDEDRVATLGERVAADIYGQDKAVAEVAQAVQMAKAGLTEPDKPLASLLFVGPTGVGKTEVARVLARELGVELVRFDMSEYTEKHTVAKLIGSPAGYVGYEDGGLLTDAIRKTPQCVLLLDEIEKAHQDIYNILLQVMDYARLTDNKGNHADFRNVILIMTSNAGAQHASKARVGFASGATAGQAMLAEVKRTFKPEFLNRLSATVVFNEMDRAMARLILDKRLRSLRRMLEAKNVTLSLTPAAEELLLDQGFTREYGAREIDRVITSRLKTLLMREILYGGLKDGGEARVDAEGDGLVMKKGD